jgi:hypothetical protein
MSRLINGPRRFGPGSMVTVVGLVAFALFGYITQPGPIKSSYYEADSTGTLKLVDRPSTPPGLTPLPLVLVKPEPSLLLRDSISLKLTAEQRSKLNDINEAWTSRKQQLRRLMNAEVASATPQEASRISLAELQSGLSEYSRLSAAYDAERQVAWERALQTLHPNQKQRVDRFLQGGQR